MSRSSSILAGIVEATRYDPAALPTLRPQFLTDPARRREVLPLVGLSIVLWIIFAGPKVLQHMSGNTADLDTGNYHHLAWAILHGDAFASSILGRHHLGEHCSPVMALVSSRSRRSGSV